MSRAWIKMKKPQFVRDVLRDFCKAAKALEEQFQAFDDHGAIDFMVLRDLLGEERNKGLLWRLKDTAHHVFRSDRDARLVGQFLDWCVGYIFHETVKLKEDAYQQQTYASWCLDMQAQDLPRAESVICQELYEILRQTRQSMEREIARIRFIMLHCRQLFPIYLQPHGNNPLLARFLFEEAELVAHVFGAEERELLRAIYDEKIEDMYLLAAQSLRRGGWMDKAASALARAGSDGADS